MALVDDAKALLEQRMADLDAAKKAIQDERDTLVNASMVLDRINGHYESAKNIATDYGKDYGVTVKIDPAVNPKNIAAVAKPKKSRRGRPKGQGKRLEMIQRVLDDYNVTGLTTTEIATKMQMKPNYLYRALPNLEQAGKVRRDDNKPPRWYPT